ncbi:MAG TPA: lactate racemase domain-containing protein, partial [Lentisphaeria bacterium]|nr:lactate racemase domain-containing protein [Lentisphaeria bacterium]
MVMVKVPYGRGHLEFAMPAENLVGVFESRLSSSCPSTSGFALVEKSLAQPIGSPSASALARGKRTAVIIASDHTRPVPSQAIFPPLLQELRRGNPGLEITILIATGMHRASTHAELLEKFGPEIMAKERIVVHDSRDSSQLVNLGALPSGGQLWVNRIAIETDLLLAEGFIEPHFFAGFSG